jgi:nucleoprotein TPR
LKLLHVRPQEKFQSKIQDLQRARAADVDKATAQQEVAVKAAIASVKIQSQIPNASSVSEDVFKRHAEELRVLEERLTAKHQEELKAAIKASEERKSTGALSSEVDHTAAIAAAIAAHEKEIQGRHAEEIASAVERGRMEQATKGKLKDSQLVKSQKRVKELETQILEWRKAGILPEPQAVPSAATPAASTSNVVPAPPATPKAAPVAGAPTPLPRKPSLPATMTTAEGVGRGARGAARGVVRARGLNIRGAAPGRGGAPAVPLPNAPNTTSGVSIVGAAAKRSREEGETPNDSLVKRLKPAPTESGGGPVTLRRPPPP